MKRIPVVLTKIQSRQNSLNLYGIALGENNDKLNDLLMSNRKNRRIAEKTIRKNKD